MNNLILYIIAVVAVTMAVLCLFKKIDIVYAVIMSIAAVTIIYGGMSIVFYRIYRYTVFKVLIATLVVSIAALIIVLILKKRPTYSFSLKKNLIPVIMISVIGLVSVFAIRSDYYGLNDYMGRIQSKAMKMMTGTDIYGIVQEEYYYVYSNEDLSVYDDVMTESEDLLRSANNTLSAEMALAGSIIGYHNMIYIYPFMIAVLAYLVYIAFEMLIKKYLSTVKAAKYAGAGIILAASVGALIIMFGGRTGIAWSELEFIAGDIHSQDSIIVDDSIINEVYIPLRYITNSTVLPQMGKPEEIGSSLLERKVYGYNEDRNITYITKEGNIQDNPITNGTYDFSTIQTGNYRLYKSAEQYVYETNDYNGKGLIRYINMIVWLIIGIISGIAAFGMWKAVRGKKASFLYTLLESIGVYGAVYTIIFRIYINKLSSGKMAYAVTENGMYAAGSDVSVIIPNCLAATTWICILIAAVTFIILELKYKNIVLAKETCKVINFTSKQEEIVDVSEIKESTPQKFSLKNMFYPIKIVEALIFVAVILIVVMFLKISGNASYICDGVWGNIQAGALSLITDNPIRYTPDFYKMVAGTLHSVSVAWFAGAGSILGIHNMMYGVICMGTAVSGIVMIVIDILAECRVLKSAADYNYTAKLHINVIKELIYCFFVIVITIIMIFKISGSVTEYSWEQMENCAEGIKKEDSIVVNSQLEQPFAAMLETYTGAKVYTSNEMHLYDGSSLYYVATDENLPAWSEIIKNEEAGQQNDKSIQQNEINGLKLKKDSTNKQCSLVKKDDKICIYRIIEQ